MFNISFIPKEIITSSVITAAIVVMSYIIAELINIFAVSRLGSLTRFTRWHWDDLLIASIRKVITPICIVLGIFISLRFWDLPDKHFDIIYDILFTIMVITISTLLITVSNKFVRAYGALGGKAGPAVSLTKNIATIVIIICALLIILHEYNVSIAPLLTALGVGGVAVALAMQETLSNLVAGINITMTGDIKTGDYIKLDSGEEGFITDITWRETRLKMRENNLLRIPNSRLTKAILTHYNLPVKELCIFFLMGIDYKSDLDHVEQVTLEVANEIQQTIAEATRSFTPRLRYLEFADYSINFRVVLGADTFEGQFLIRHNFIKLLHKRYKEEGINIPFPIRTLYVED